MSIEESPHKKSSLETVNKQLLENQSFLYTENERLQENVSKLSKHLEELRQSTMDPHVLEQLVQEKAQLIALNDSLKQKIKTLKALPSGINKQDVEKQKTEKQELLKSIEELDIILGRINGRPETFDISIPKESTVRELCQTLTKRLEEEQRRGDEAYETIRRLREDDEKLVLRDKIADLKQLITDLEVENTKLKFDAEQLTEDVQRYKKDAADADQELKESKRERYDLEDERDRLKQKICDMENEKIKLKKEMIEELTEANRAKRISADTEIALEHISEAYENKRKEVQKYQKQLEEANGIIRAFREQFETLPQNTQLSRQINSEDSF